MFVHNETIASPADRQTASIHSIRTQSHTLRYRSHRTVLRMRGMGKCCNTSGVIPQADLLFMAVRILTAYRNECGAGLQVPLLPKMLEIQKEIDSGVWYLACELPAGSSVSDWNHALKNNHVTVDLRHVAGLEAVREPGGVVLEMQSQGTEPIGSTALRAVKEACWASHYTIDGTVSWMFPRPPHGKACHGGTYMIPITRQQYSYAC